MPSLLDCYSTRHSRSLMFFSVVNCPVIVLNVFYSTILMRLMLLAVAQPIILFGKGQSIMTSVTDVFQQLKIDTTNQ